MCSASSLMFEVVQLSGMSNHDILVISKSKPEELQNRSLSETGGGFVMLQILNLSQYYYEEML